ncbi:hypothetical protein [Amycolatopsis pittospori]|uniref:hypothetical protein n=1 Tax=Amycolatopsis pittospori TaxID=2749434 RepID=UPI0015F006D1|nr:hypothetical protein [Amycolatopsis pittospori]
MRTVLWISAALAALATVGVLTALPRSEVLPEHLPVAVFPAERSFPFELYTHCGVDEALVEGVYFEADLPLAGPPPEWGNPYQQGTMTLPKPGRAVFRDSLGHEVVFHARPGATGFKRICE